MRFFETALIVSIVVAVSLASHEKEHDGHRRSYTINPGKVGHEGKSKFYLCR